MKLFLLVVLIASFTFQSFSQNDKALKKEWAKKMKEMDPLEFKQKMEDYEATKSQLAAKSGELTTQEEKVKSLENDKLNHEQEIATLKEEIERLKSSTVKMPKEKGEKDISHNNLHRQNANTKGLVFKVQIGAFKIKNLTKYFDNNKNFSGEVDEDGTKKYTLGYFTDYWEADTFKKYLREMGVKDAWIVPYKDGQRLNIKDVLEGVI